MSAARAALLAAALLAALAAPGPARAASDIGYGQFGLAPSPSAGGQPRPYFNLQVSPGQTATDTVVVSNLSKAAEEVRLSTSDGITATNSGSAYEPTGPRCKDSGCWISGLPSVVTVAAGASKSLPFQVRVPAGTQPAQYLSGITAQLDAPHQAVHVGGRHSSAKAIIIDQVTVGVAVTVGQLSQLRTVVRIGPVTGSWIGPVARLSIGVTNLGQTFAQASGTVSCTSRGDRHTYPVTMNTVLVNGGAALAVNARGLSTGLIPCTVSLRDNAGHTVTWSGTVRLGTPTLTRTYRTAKGVYVSLPQSTMPPWAIALMIIGALIVALLLVTLLRSRRAGRPAIRRH